MNGILRWLQKDKFQAQTLAFLLMIIPAALLYQAATRGWVTLTWMLIAAVVLGNVIVLLVK